MLFALRENYVQKVMNIMPPATSSKFSKLKFTGAWKIYYGSLSHLILTRKRNFSTFYVPFMYTNIYTCVLYQENLDLSRTHFE